MFTHPIFKTIPILLAITLIFTCSSSQPAQQTSHSDTQNLDRAISSILNQVSGTASDQQLRLAVIEFVPTQIKYKQRNEFGRYFTERLTTALKSTPKNIKLFERRQLETIIKEHKLNLSGLIDESLVIKIGRLAPIDKIVTGSYTRLKTTIDINGRILDVMTGEIVQTFHFKVKLTENLLSLFETQSIKKPLKGIAKPEKDCSEEKENINRMLGNLSSEQRINTLVDYAVTIPFHSKCGEYHAQILYDFMRNKIFSETYKQFLIESLSQTLNTPHNSNKMLSALKYFAKDGWVDEAEWNAGIEVLKRVYKHWINVYTNYMFITENLTPEEITIQKKRIDTFFQLVEQNKIALPTPVDPGTAFLELIHTFIVEDNHQLFYYCYDNYHTHVAPKKRYKLFKILTKLHERYSDDDQKPEALNRICAYFNRMPRSDKLAGQMYDLYRTLSNTRNKDPNPALNEKQLKVFVSRCREAMISNFPIIKYNNQRKELQLFCYKHEITIPNFTYTVPQLEKQLSDKNRYKRENAAEFLVEMGMKAKPSEKTVLKFLRRAKYLKLSTRTQKYLIDILGNIKSGDPEVHRILIKNLSHRGSYVPDRAKVALASIGKPAIGLLKKELPKQETYVQIYIVDIFGRMGKEASSVKPFLKTLKAKTTSDHLRFAIEDALEKI